MKHSISLKQTQSSITDTQEAFWLLGLNLMNVLGWSRGEQQREDAAGEGRAGQGKGGEGSSVLTARTVCC